MDHFNYRNGELFAEDVPVARIAERFGTPAYVYSRATLERHYRATMRPRRIALIGVLCGQGQQQPGCTQCAGPAWCRFRHCLGR